MATEMIGRNIAFKIYNADGTEFHNLVLHKATYDSVVMSLGDKITGDVYYKDNTLQVTMREYVEYKGVRFVLVNPPTIVKEGIVSDNSELRGTTKYSFEFYHPMHILNNIPFTDVAVSSDQEKYLSQNKTFSWIGTCHDFINKLNKNLQGTEWVVIASGDADSETKMSELSDVLSFDKQYIGDALKTIYETWGVPFVIDSLEQGEYYDENNRDYYSLGKKFVIVIGVPSNEIINQGSSGGRVVVADTTGNSIPPHYSTPVTVQPYRKIILESLDADAYPLILDASSGGVIGTTNRTFTETKSIFIGASKVGARIKYFYDDEQDGVFVFRYGQGVGLKNNSRTPRNNKIVTRISGCGSEENVPYGYPQIVWEGSEDDARLKYPLYKGIVGGKYVTLIKHPFTRTTLMPSIYAQCVNRKVNPNASGYNPDIELVDYYDAVYSSAYPYANEINLESPSHETKQFEEIKPELDSSRSLAITSAIPVNDSDLEPASSWVDDIDDDGNYKQSYFKITIPQLDFDVYACASITQEMKINMRSGACIGCTFEISVDWDDYKANFYDQDGNFAPDGEQRDLEKYPKSDASSITLVVKKDIDTFGTLMPNIYQFPKAGDTFVILGISLPTTYITNAEQRLDEAMKKYMLENNIYYYDYPLKFDEYFLANNTKILSQIRTNSIIRFEFANELMMLYVKQITIKYGEKPLPEYSITLTDNIEVVLNQITKVEGEISSLSSLVLAMKRGQYGGQSSGGGSVTGDYISKTNDDVANGVIGFLKGLWVGVKAWFWDKDGNINANTITLADKVDSLRVLTNTIKSHNYNGEGLLDTGFTLTSDDGSGKSKLVVDNAYFRGKVVMESVEIRKIYHTGGNEIKSPAAQTNVRVDYFMDIDEYGNPVGQAGGYTYVKVPWLVRSIRLLGLARKNGSLEKRIWSRYKRVYVGISEEDMPKVKVFRCYAKSDDGTMQTRGGWMVDDQAFCQTLNLVSDKSASTGEFSGRLSNKHYWRRVCGIGTARLEDGKLYDYVDLLADDCEAGSDYPEAGDDMVCLGNRVDPERQSAIIFEVIGSDSPSMKEYANINGYTLDGKRMTMISPKAGDEFYARRFSVITGSMVTPVPVDRGEWDVNVVRQRQGYYYYDRVTFTDPATGKGGYWLCLYNPNRTKYYYRDDVTVCTPEQYDAMTDAEKETYRTLTRITKAQYDALTDSQKYYYKHTNGTEYTAEEFNELTIEERAKCTKMERYVEYEDFTIEKPSLQSTKWRLHVSNGSSYKGATEYYALGNSETVAPAGYNRMIDGKRVPDPTVWYKETRPAYDTTTDEGRAKMYLWNMEMTIDSFGEEFWTDPICVGNESKGITGYDEYYGISAYATKKADGSPTDTTIAWVAKNASIQPTEVKPFLWNHSVTTYSDGTKFETWRVVAVHGKPGSSYGGFQEYYKLSEYSDEAHKPAFDVNDPLKAANGWSTTIPTYNGGAARFLWNAEVSSSTAYSLTDGSGYTGQTTKQAFVVCIGDHAKGISNVSETYGVSTSAEYNGAVPKVMPSSFGTFAIAFAALNATYRFIWNKTVTTYTDGSSETHYHVCFTKNIDISDFKELFVRHNSNSSIPTSIYNTSTDADKDVAYYTAKGWSTTHPPYNNDGNVYLWNMEVTSLDDGTHSTTPPHCIGNFANGIKDIEDWYVLSTDGINNPDSTAGAQGKIGNWVKGVMPAITPDTFLWDKEVVKFTDGNLQDSLNYHVIAMYAADGKDAPLGVLSDTQVSVPCDSTGKVLSAFSEEILCDLVLNGVANIVPDTITFEGDTANYVTKKSGKNDTLVVNVAANATLTEETIKVTIQGYDAAKTSERYTGVVYFHIKRWKSGDGFKQEFCGALAETVTAPTVATYANFTWYDVPHTQISSTLQCLYAALWAIDANGNKKGTQPLAVWLSSRYGEDGADGKDGKDGKDGVSIASANVWYALSTIHPDDPSYSSPPADSAFTLDNFPTTLNAGYYVWQATKIIKSNGTSGFTGKMCLGATSDFLSGTEVYAISTSNSATPDDNLFGTTYNKTKGYYLWTATRVQYTSGKYAYLNKKCVGYWGEDGADGVGFDSIVVRGSCNTGSGDPHTNDIGVIITKGATTTFVAHANISVDSVSGLRRGLALIVVSKATLTVVSSQFYDVYYDYAASTTRRNALATAISNTTSEQFVCLLSLDALYWNTNLVSALESCGSGGIDTSKQHRYPFVFIGYKGLQQGYAMQYQGEFQDANLAEAILYIDNGIGFFTKDGVNGTDGKDGITVGLTPDSILFNENSSGGTIDLSNNTSTIIVKRGGTPIVANDTSNGYVITNRSLTYSKDSRYSSTQQCNATFTQSVIAITAINKKQYTDNYGTHSVYFEQGYVDAKFTLTTYKNNTIESSRDVTLRLSFFVNTLGSFRLDIIGDTETQIATKTVFDAGGGKTTTLGTFVTSSSQKTSTLERQVQDENGNLVLASKSELRQTAEEINIEVKGDGYYQLLDDTDFVSGDMDAWNEQGGSIVTYSSHQHNGYNSYYGTKTSADGVYRNILMQELWKPDGSIKRITKNKWYTLSFYAKGSGMLTTHIYPGCVDYTVKAIVDGQEVTIGDDGQVNWSLTSDWAYHVLVFKTLDRDTFYDSQGTVASIQYLLFRLLTNGNYVYISQPRLEIGKVDHDYKDDVYGLKRTGIDIEKGVIKLDASTVVATGNFYVPRVISENSAMVTRVESGHIEVRSKTTQSYGVFEINSLGEIILSMYDKDGKCVINIGGTPNTLVNGEWVTWRLCKKDLDHVSDGKTYYAVSNSGCTSYYQLKLGQVKNTEESLQYFLPPARNASQGLQTTDTEVIACNDRTFTNFTTETPKSAMEATIKSLSTIPDGYYIKANDGVFMVEANMEGPTNYIIDMYHFVGGLLKETIVQRFTYK